MATTIKLYHANEMIFRDSLFYRGEGKIFDKTRALKEFPENYVIVGEFRVNDGGDFIGPAAERGVDLMGSGRQFVAERGRAGEDDGVELARLGVERVADHAKAADHLLLEHVEYGASLGGHTRHARGRLRTNSEH